jgi:hypothetical protein
MALILQDQPRQQRQPERESILELLGRGFASGAGQSLGTGLGQLATQGLGRLMDPNQRPLDAQTLEALGVDPMQAKSIAAIKNPSIQRDIVNATQQRQAESQERELKQKRSAQFANAANQLIPQGQEGAVQPSSLTAADVDAMELADFKDLVKLGQKERHAKAADIRQSHQDNKKYTTKARDRAESAEEGEGIVNAMESLEKTGKVESGPWAELLSKHGLESFLNPESIAFEKLRATFLGGAKNVIGGRVTNQEMQQFMKSIPSLSQSPEGRAMIYANMRNKFELDKQYYQTIQDVENEYAGRPLPHNFESIVHQRMKPHYKSFQDKFKTVEDINKKNSEPSAAEFNGKIRRNKKTGAMEKSNGVEWLPVEENVAQVQPKKKTNFMSTGNKIGRYPWKEQ